MDATTTVTAPEPAAGRGLSSQWQPVAYWLATAAVAGEMGLGGSWDVARLDVVKTLVTRLGYPTYVLVLLGIWKILGAIVLLIPRRPVLKEWAYAGAFFTYSGAIVSHLATGYGLGELWLLVPVTALTMLSWALRPSSRRLASQHRLASPLPAGTRGPAGWRRRLRRPPRRPA